MGKVIPIRPDDQAARERIRTSLDESLIVEAAAGTGKTAELIRRIVAGFRSGKISTPDRLVAVTFTRKAAGELKLRLREELDCALKEARSSNAADRNSKVEVQNWESRDSDSSETKTQKLNSIDAGGEARPDGDEIRNLENAITHLEEAHIGTIHSFCAEILRERPVEANVDPAFHELSEPESQRLYRQAFRRWSQEKLSASPPGLRRCLSRLASRSASSDSSPLQEVEAAGWKLVQWRDFAKPWQRRPFERERGIDQLVREVFRLAELLSRCPRQGDELVQAMRAVSDLKTWIERAEAARGRKLSERDYDVLEGRLLILLQELRRRTKIGRGKFAEDVSREQVVERRDSLVLSLENFKREADAELAALLQDEMRDLIK
jgi:ATP-dependent helicase/nuclease subunit A